MPGGTLLFTATPAEGASHDFHVYSCLNQVHAQLGLKQRFLSHRGLGNATGLTGRVGGLGLSGNPQQRLLAARHPVSKPPCSLAFITGRSTPLLRDAAGPPREPPRGHRRKRHRRKQLRAAGPECAEVRGARAPGLRAGGAPGRGLTSAAKRTPSTRCSEPWSSQEPQCRWHCRSL